MGLVVPTVMHLEQDDQPLPYEWFVGIDWGAEKHQICVLDRDRRQLGERVVDHDRSHRTGRMEHETVPVTTFIGRMGQHALPKGCKRIRYYGGQATKTFAKVKEAMRAALAKVEGVVKGAVKIIARLTYRQRYAQSTGRDPCICPHGGHEMGVWRIWHPTYGVIHDEGEVIKRGTYASSAQRAGP